MRWIVGGLQGIFGSMMWLVNLVLKLLLVGGGLVLLLLAGIPLCTWVYVELNLSRAGATVLEKSQEIIELGCGRWQQDLQLRVNYSPSDTRVAEQTWIRVDEGTWVRSQPGSRVEVSYVPVAALRQIPLYYTKGLAEPLPPMPQAQDVQRSASAVVKKIHHVIQVAGPARHGCGWMDAWQPFDMVELTLIPEGKNEAVTALDSMDSASGLNLAVGKPVTVNYSSSYPLAAKIAGASRQHIWKNRVEQVAVYGLPVALLVAFLMWVTRKARRARS
jgi:hypothetical protein